MRALFLVLLIGTASDSDCGTKGESTADWKARCNAQADSAKESCEANGGTDCNAVRRRNYKGCTASP